MRNILRLANEIWDSFTIPHPRIKNEEERLNSHLLSRALIFSMPFIFLFLIVLSYLYGPSAIPDLIVFGVLLFIIAGVYWINRRGYFKMAGLTLFLLGSLSIFIEVLWDDDFGDLAYLVLLLNGASLFFSKKIVFLISMLYVAGAVLILWLFPSDNYLIGIPIIAPLLTIGAILNIVRSSHRDKLEALRNQQITASELRYSLIVESVNDGVWDWDMITNEIYFSPRWKTMLGYKEEQIRNIPDEWFKRIHPEDQAHVQSSLNRHIQGKTASFETEYRIQHADGGERWMLCRGLAVRDFNGTVHRMAGSQTDITDRKLTEARLLHDALHDALTGLPNRVLFMDRLKFRLEHAKRHPKKLFAVLFIDIDRFKVVNDSLGHAIGDQLLIATARRLQFCVRPEDTVSRLSGDEFAVLLNEVGDVSDSIRVAERIQARMKETTVLAAVHKSSTASIGIALFNNNYTKMDEMLRDADIAMYRAKTLGGGFHQIFDPDMQKDAFALLQLEADLKRAVENLEWLVYYQPIISLKSGEIVGVEALVRWAHPQQWIIPPLEFIHIAEETGAILPIGEFVLRTACQQTQAWREAGFPKLWVSVNLSARQFQNQNLVRQITQTLSETGLPNEYLRMEVTESVAMQDLDHSLSVMKELTKLGVRFSLDDFGNGYSSLSSLRQFPLKVLKIDQSFIRDIQADKNSEAIVSAIIVLARSIDLEVIAEGVEKVEQLVLLRSLSCDNVQGFFLSHPIPANELTILLQKRISWKFPDVSP